MRRTIKVASWSGPATPWTARASRCTPSRSRWRGTASRTWPTARTATRIWRVTVPCGCRTQRTGSEQMTHRIETQIFDEPSGDVRGVVYALRGKDRIAHAYLHKDGKLPKITLDKVRGKPTVADVR